MATERITLHPDASNEEQIEKAARALADGALVAFPTETVYGLASNAANGESVERLRKIKGHSDKRPFTVHIGRRADCEDFVPQPSAIGRRLMKKGWPGPLTLVFGVDDPSQAKIHRVLSPVGAEAIYMDKTVGVRFPDHAVAGPLLAAANAPIIATSANVTGAAPPTEAEGIAEQISDNIDLILDGGPTRYEKGSTVVALNGDGYRLLRSGVLDERAIQRLSTINILFVCTGNTCRSPMAEGIFKQMAAAKLGCQVADLPGRGVVVASAGTLGVGGGRASKEAGEVCGKRGVDLSRHTTRSLTVDLIQSADHIFTMGRHHMDMVRSMVPPAVSRTLPLDPDRDVNDPIGGTVEDYGRVADTLTEALKLRINEVSL